MLAYWKLDKYRMYGIGSPPIFLYWYRVANTNNIILKNIGRIMLRIFNFLYHVDLSYKTTIGPGLYIGHPFGITINPKAQIGKNVNIHKGVTIGQENRGQRAGVPQIGDCVWIGINSTIVGAITIGEDVLIAPNSFVNCNIPPHSIVFGNPCIIKNKDNATDCYIQNKI